MCLKKESKVTVEQIEKHIDFWTECLGTRAANISETEENPFFGSKKKSIDYSAFVLSADEAYFVSRVLFMNGILLQSFFFARQCVENYLKAFLLKEVGQVITGHDLNELLNRCLKCSQPDFLESVRARTIIQRFDPFYELPRYPLQRLRPKKGQYLIQYPDDIYPLDYFVYMMRLILPLSKRKWDVLSEGKPPMFSPPDTYPEQLFKLGNINFK